MNKILDTDPIVTVIRVLNDAKLDANVANLIRLSDRVTWYLEAAGETSLAHMVETAACTITDGADRTADDVDRFRTACAVAASKLYVAHLAHDDEGDAAGRLVDAGQEPTMLLEHLPRIPRDRDETIVAAIPNRATGRTYSTTRVRVTHRIPNIGDRPSYDETVDLDVVGVSSRTVGFGGGILTGFRVDGELPVVSIPTSSILELTPLVGPANEADPDLVREIEAGRACGLHDRPLPCLEC